ncbi:hypothetical protein B005_3556 [Nocardiopsis alba ATCC BAA-2165]|uniref:Uncharacterized protein n=1 Tax=Nocardiopsis alba (strain ATCC BAA-2165 / BE74) TaxID=1205910 RepID=J7LEF7_NOCAA|nr:hypothetical protein B005_3556 [Nocardiopsis alba ATCC BAA-2165]
MPRQLVGGVLGQHFLIAPPAREPGSETITDLPGRDLL